MYVFFAEPPTQMAEKPKIRRAIVSIEGMTCHACVNNIQDTVGSKDGIVKIVVSLEQKQGNFPCQIIMILQRCCLQKIFFKIKIYKYVLKKKTNQKLFPITEMYLF